ncbi:MAG: hypothetical protein JO208_05130 [Alphaproteobacteria bacterium]|nr:hypothetical protein [Alphaproteobacteria bacterium]
MTYDPTTVYAPKPPPPFQWVDQTATLLIGIGSIVFVAAIIFGGVCATQEQWGYVALAVTNLAAGCLLLLAGGMAKVLLDIRETVREYVSRQNSK